MNFIITILNSSTATGTIGGTLGTLLNAVSPEDYGGDLAAAVATGKDVYIPENKTYTINSAITLGIRQKVIGANKHTSKIVVPGNHRGFVLQNGSEVHNIKMEGAGLAAGHNFNVGIGTTDVDWAITNCIFTGFSGTENAGAGGGGIQCIGGVGDYKRGAKIIGCLFDGNVTGINIMEKAEFLHIAHNDFFNNGTALVSRGGNNRLISLNMVGNTVAYSMQAGFNNGHGSMVGCTVNHNATNLKINDQALGFAFSGCHFYDGNIEITNSEDITFSNCHIPGTAPTPNTMTLTNNAVNGVRIDAISKYVPAGYNKVLTGNDLVIV